MLTEGVKLSAACDVMRALTHSLEERTAAFMHRPPGILPGSTRNCGLMSLRAAVVVSTLLAVFPAVAFATSDAPLLFMVVLLWRVVSAVGAVLTAVAALLFFVWVKLKVGEVLESHKQLKEMQAEAISRAMGLDDASGAVAAAGVATSAAGLVPSDPQLAALMNVHPADILTNQWMVPVEVSREIGAWARRRRGDCCAAVCRCSRSLTCTSHA